MQELGLSVQGGLGGQTNDVMLSHLPLCLSDDWVDASP
jgi:hypothetical protein